MSESSGEIPSDSSRCVRCRGEIAEGGGFRLGGAWRCPRCALCYRPLLRRSLMMALVVGTLLVLINQGTVLITGQLPVTLLLQLLLTYCVPSCVATWSVLSTSTAA